MKLVNYQLQNQIEYLSDSKSTKFFKEYLQGILEDTSKSHFQKCDYVGLSFQELKSKIDTLGKDIQELQALKKNLSNALDIAKSLTAEIFVENGIDRIDGNIISSLTLTKPSSKTKDVIAVKDQNAVMGLGHVKFSVDLESVEKSLQTKKGQEELKEFVDVVPMIIETPAKIKVNTKRNPSNNETDEILIIEEQVA
jgi:hypothetical protein